MFSSIVNLFNKNSVEYLLIGGHAVNYHGYVRATMDMDIWLNETKENLKKFSISLQHLDYDDKKIENAISALLNEGIINISKENQTIDILGRKLIRLDFADVYNRREIAVIDGLEISIIGIDDLIINKMKSNRVKDLLDAKELKEIRKHASGDS